MSNEALRRSYERSYIAHAYDTLIAMTFAPVGGARQMRAAAIEALEVRASDRVLELGCGSGAMTRLLVERGAEVTAVDWSRPMLEQARRRAPGARFELGDVSAYAAPAGAYDVVLFSFVLHELSSEGRAAALANARRALAANGRVAVVDHARGERGALARALSAIVHAFEPASSRAWLPEGAAERALAAAGFEPGERVSLAAGMAFALLGFGKKRGLSDA